MYHHGTGDSVKEALLQKLQLAAQLPQLSLPPKSLPVLQIDKLLSRNGKERHISAQCVRNAAVLQRIRNAEQFGAEICGIVKGSLSIGCYYSVSALWMPKILTVFRARYPGVTVRMQEGGNLEMARWLSERSVDCCFGAKPKSDVYDWLPVFRDELVAWLPQDHPLADRPAFPLDALQEEPFIYTSPNHDTDLDRLLAAHDLHPRTCFTTRDGFTTYNMVGAGLGVSFNQRLISRRWNGTVTEVPFDPPQFVTLGISVPSLKEASPAARKFIDCAIETVSAEEHLKDR